MADVIIKDNVKNSKWRPMWESLGIDMEKHDFLLSVLPDIYKQVYIDSQKNRPENMAFWDFVVGDIHGIRPSELVEAKKNGKKVIGTFCLYVPDEIIYAMDAISVGLCGGTNFSNFASEQLLPANTCPLIKSALGFGLGNICPYYASADLLIGETTCDGKKKAWEILSEYNNIYVVETPQKKEDPYARQHYISELYGLISKLEEVTGNKLKLDNLVKAIEKIQKKRDLLAKIYSYRKKDPVPISGKDALLISQVAFYDDPDRQIEMLSKLANELEQRVKKGTGVFEKGRKRILISGTPMAIPNWKLHHLIESNGAVVVAEETCTGTRYFENRITLPNIDNDRKRKTNEEITVEETHLELSELIESIADRYLNINCACFTPNKNRAEDIKRLAKEFKADGIILYNLSFCQPYEIESIGLEKDLKSAGYPVITITTDYSSEDEAQLQTRIEAFIEMLK